MKKYLLKIISGKEWPLFYSAMNYALSKAFPLMTALLFLGVGYGIYMRSCGFNAIWPVCMAATIFAGSMEFMTIGLLLGSFHPFYALLLTLIVNGRHLFYSISMLELYRNTGWKKFVLVSGLIDEAFSLNYTTPLPPRIDKNRFMWFVTLFLYLSWILGTAIGAFFSPTAVAKIKGMEFIMTALFIVIFIGQWQREKSHVASLTGLIVASTVLPIVGRNYFMLLSIIIVSILFSVYWFITKKHLLK